MVPPVRPVRLYEIGVFVEVGDNGDWPGVTVVLPDASVGDVPHVMDKVLDAPKILSPSLVLRWLASQEEGLLPQWQQREEWQQPQHAYDGKPLRKKLFGTLV